MLVLSLVGCAGESGPGLVVLDSAGVEIVEVNAAEWPAGDGWSIDAEPMLRLGVASGDPAQEFNRIRGAVRFSDGGLAVADGGSQEIRYFEADGTFALTTGGPGEGPGEFEFLWYVTRAGRDTVVAWDIRSRRLSLFARDGSLVGEVVADGFLRANDFVGRFADGTYLFSGAIGQTGEATGVRRSTAYYITMGANGVAADTVAIKPHSESYYFRQDRGMLVSLTGLPFGRTSFAVVADSAFYVASSDRFEIDRKASDGRLLRRIRYPPGDRPLTDEDAESLAGLVLARTDLTAGGRPNIEMLFREVPLPPRQPAFSAFVADLAGNLWVADWISELAPPSDADRDWYVFAPDGRLLGNLPIPSALTVHEIGGNYVLGTVADELGVERVELYALRK